MKNRTDKEFIRIFQDIHGHRTTRGLKPNYVRLDNEASPSLQYLLKDKCINYQMAPPDMHIQNTADRSISTFRYHFIVWICATDPYYPMQNWNRLLYQLGITLNLLRPSIFNPRLSAYAQLNGELDFNRTPISPLVPQGDTPAFIDKAGRIAG